MMFEFDNSYARLPNNFYAKLNPTPVSSPSLIKINHSLAIDLGLDADFLGSNAGIEILAGNAIADKSDPIATAYGGHQFGNWAGQLGDGRAILLGEVINTNGARLDIQLKGSGPTPFSRSGDGRAWMGPVLREYVVSEAMAALNIPTTRALAAVATGENVMRESIFPGAILTRVASSHVRVGTFEFFASQNDEQSLRLLADYVIDRHYPDALDADNPYLTLLENVISRQAKLISKWTGVGFIHGVMNTDNMSIYGETIDYGPCAFMDSYHPQTVFSYIDQMGRYAYENQPQIAGWNLAQFASTILPLINPDEELAIKLAKGAVNSFSDLFIDAWSMDLNKKIGLEMREQGDFQLAQDLLDIMANNNADFTLVFRGLGNILINNDRSVRELFNNPAMFDEWETKWHTRLSREPNKLSEIGVAMHSVNPAFIPRNHQIEQMITSALGGDFRPFNTLIEILSNPYDDQPEYSSYQMPPQPEEAIKNTFCGT